MEDIQTTEETTVLAAPTVEGDAGAASTARLDSPGGTALARFARWREQRRVWQRLARMRRWRLVLVIIFLFAFFAPLLTLGASALYQYNQLKGWGQDGVSQLLAIKGLLPSSATSGASSGTNGTVQKAKDILNKSTLAAIQKHCQAAQTDFTDINTAIANRDGIIGLAMNFGYKAKILAVQQLALVGIDGTILCGKLTALGMDFTSTFQTSPFSSSGGPILTQKSFADLQTALDDSQVLLTDIQVHVQQININDVPVSAKQRGQITQITGQLPKYLKDLQSFKPYVPLLGWALGVGTPRNYLIQTMDRGELRPSGGFNGQWGVLNLNGGRIGKLSLADVTFVDFTTTNTPTLYQQAPVQYRAWWPFANWGMRDADLSGDFPTTAQIIMGTFQREEAAVDNGIKVHLDGDIHFSPLVIEHLLVKSILGPLFMPCYNITITSTNLESELHYFQEDPSSIAIQNKCSPSKGQTSLRKRFTSALAQALEDKVRSAGQDKLLAIMGSLRQDLLSKELEIYVNNPQIEGLLAKDQLNGAINTDPKVDGTYVVQANVSVNKGWTQVTEKVNEYVALDDSGGAYHDLQISLDYHPTQNVYGEETMRDYMRIYAPPQARFITGSGFDQNIDPMYSLTDAPTPAKPLCTAPTTTTPPPTGTKPPPTGTKPPPTTTPIFPCTPTEAPYCYQGKYDPTGPVNEWLPHTAGSNSTYIDDIGGPTNFVSDMPNRAMFGGMIVIPGFCVATVDVQWYVPAIAGDGAHHNLPYTHLLQRQSGTFASYQVQIVPAQDTKLATLNASGTLTTDTAWSLKPAAGKHADITDSLWSGLRAGFTATLGGL